MLTREEKGREFWLLTKGILQDEKVDVDEARVVKRWLEEHGDGLDFSYLQGIIDKVLADGWIDRFESKELIAALGEVLRILCTPQA